MAAIRGRAGNHADVGDNAGKVGAEGNAIAISDPIIHNFAIVGFHCHSVVVHLDTETVGRNLVGSTGREHFERQQSGKLSGSGIGFGCDVKFHFRFLFRGGFSGSPFVSFSRVRHMGQKTYFSGFLA
jgi:hypothetical protein